MSQELNRHQVHLRSDPHPDERWKILSRRAGCARYNFAGIGKLLDLTIQSLRFPDPGIGRKTSGSQNIKSDVQGYSCLTERKIYRDFRARNDLWNVYFLSVHRDIPSALENSRTLIT